MKQSHRWLVAVALELSAFVLSATTGVFGALALFFQFKLISISQFIGLQIAFIALFATLGWYPLIPAAVALPALVLSFHLIKVPSLFWRGFFSTFISSSLLFLGALVVVHWTQEQSFWVYAKETLSTSLERAQGVSIPVDIDILVYQIPSYVFGLCALNLWVALIFQRKRSSLALKFSVPDPWVWILIASLLFSFVKVGVPGVQEVALNVLNIALLLYFFQGIAVLSHILETLKFSPLIKMIIYFIFIFQILLPICLGVVDYWLNLRKRLQGKIKGDG